MLPLSTFIRSSSVPFGPISNTKYRYLSSYLEKIMVKCQSIDAYLKRAVQLNNIGVFELIQEFFLPQNMSFFV